MKLVWPKSCLAFSLPCLTIRKGTKWAGRAQELWMGSPGSFQISQLTSGCLGTSHLVPLGFSVLPDQSRLIHFPGLLAQGK